MKITTQQELNDLIATANESNTIFLDEDLEITFSCIIPCSIEADNITALDIKAGHITAWNIKAEDIEADNITARDIKAHNITARDIKAEDIEAKNIKYYVFCIAHQSLKCESIAGERQNSFHKCLDQEIEFIKEDKKVTIELTQEQLDKIKHLI
jgi:hypothetical protein